MKYIIQLDTEADLITINAGLQPLLNAIQNNGLAIRNFSILETK